METVMSEDPQVVILFFTVSLVIGIVCKKLLHGTKVPYTVAVFLLGIVLGYIEYGTNVGLGKLGTSIRLWANINPDLILFVFLPPLLFESTFSMEAHQVKRCLAQMVLLAGPGVLISTFSIGTMIHLLFPFGWNWTTSFLLGGLLSATDPVAVVAFLKELGASKKLSTMIEGESIMNDGVSIVVFRLFLQMVLGQTLNVPKSIKFLSQVSFGAIALGLLFGLIPFVWLGFTRNDVVTELTLTFAVSYIAYFYAEDGVHVSGIITVTTLGILFSSLVKLSFKGERQQIMRNFWETISYVANTLVFILSGTIIAESIHQSIIDIQGYTWGYVLLLYTFLQLSRGLVVGVLYPGLQYFGNGLDWKEAIILVWSGLRGVVALSLSLSVHRTSEGINSEELSKKDGSLFVFFTGGVVFLTLILNGITTQLLLHLLGMQKSTISKKKMTNYTRFKMNNKVLETFRRSGEDEELGQANWPSIIKYITCVNSPRERQTQPRYSIVNEVDLPLTANEEDLTLTANEEDLHSLHVQDIRLKLLSGVRAAYSRMLDDEKITQSAAILLMKSVDEALDLAISHEALLDWKGLSAYILFPDYFKYLRCWFFPKKLVTFLTVKRLEFGCYICEAFLQAHSISRRQLYDFIGGSDTAQVVIQESEAEGESAKQYLEDVRLTFPQVVSAVKIKQLTCSSLLELIHYVHDLEKVGLLNDIEMNELQNAVETDLLKFGRNPPSIKMPKLNDILASQPLIRHLPSTSGEPLGSSAKMVMKLRGSILYNQSSEPDGIWLIATGVVKCDSTDFADRHVPNPTFTCGSTLGLYEALTGKPNLCVLIAESAVHCFFIEKKKILSCIESAPETEELFWKESALVLTKLLSPQQFEVFSVEELRDSFFEQSTMHILLRDEVIEIRPHDVIILLEGFVKQIGRMMSVEAPAILTSNAKHHQIALDQPGARFQALTGSRIIIFSFEPIIQP